MAQSRLQPYLRLWSAAGELVPERAVGNLQEIRRDLSLGVLHMLKKANAGHIGSCLSCVEIMVACLFEEFAGAEDQFLLSKGHAACALYNALAMSNRLPPELLKTFYQDGTRLSAHPPCQGPDAAISAIPFGTGSLGHGLSLAAGMALARRFKREAGTVTCVLSDGECNEGSTWEAALFAAHHRLGNLWVIVDANGLQGFGNCIDVLKADLPEIFRAFGFAVAVAENGHSFASLRSAFGKLRGISDLPKCVIARTHKGNGVSFMQNKLEWHYLPMSAEEYAIAVAEINAAGAP